MSPPQAGDEIYSQLQNVTRQFLRFGLFRKARPIAEFVADGTDRFGPGPRFPGALEMSVAVTGRTEA